MTGKYTYVGKRGRRLRSFLLCANAFCAVLGIAVIATGTYLVAQKLQFMTSVYGTHILAAAGYFSVAAGSILFLVAFVGFFAALFYSRALLRIYLVIVAIVFFLGLFTAVLALVFQYQVYAIVKVYMKESLLVWYGTNMDDPWNNFVTRSWDEIQQNLECCALDRRGWMMYRQTFWYRDLPGLQTYNKPYVPFSCCKRTSSRDFVDLRLCQFNGRGPPGLPPYLLIPRNGTNSNYDNPALYTNGCYQAGRDAFVAIAKYFAVIGFFFAIIVVALVASSFALYNSI